MDSLEITSLSTKGQIVIPRSIRNQLNLDTGDKLIVVCDGTNILLKPVLMPSMSEFKTLVEETDKITSELETTPDMLSAFINENRSTSLYRCRYKRPCFGYFSYRSFKATCWINEKWACDGPSLWGSFFPSAHKEAL